jgi:hypothetical protein
MFEVVDFDKIIPELYGSNSRHLLLGNGFSIALKPDIFSYSSLYENADFSGAEHLPSVFNALKTTDFEVVIRTLQDAGALIALYGGDEALAAKLHADAQYLKEALVQAIAKRHPSRPYDITGEKYRACRAFLNNFKNIFTLNYDVLLYWALMQDEVDDINLAPDDGFRHPEDDYDQPYVSWQQAHTATVSYLHGALHLFDNRQDIIKYTWSKTEVPIIDQIRSALKEDKFPLFVAEGTSDQKRDRILHNAYLHKALRSFEGCCNSKKASITIYGHSLADNDAHVLRCIIKGNCSNLYVSLYGDPLSEWNQSVIKNAQYLVRQRELQNARSPLKLTFFDAQSASVWG